MMKIGLKDGTRRSPRPVVGHALVVSKPMSSIISSATSSATLGPDVDDLVVALAVGDEPLLVLLDDLVDLGLRLRRAARPWPGITMSSMQIEMPALVA